MKTITKLFVLSFVVINLSSCYTTRATIGSGPVKNDKHVRVYSKAKQVYLFAGLIPLGVSSPAIPADKNCQIKTKFNFFDLLISTVTLSIVNTRTTQVLVHDPGNN